MNINWQNKTAIITGASSGIGEATARKLAQMGMQVILVARREERLAGVQAAITSAGGKALAIAADLGSEKERVRVFDQAGKADVLINNAGFGWYGYFHEMSWETAHEMLRVNIAAAAHLTSLFLPGMLVRNYGHIINVGSIAGSLPSQGVAMYGATKSFLDNFTSALVRELRGTNIHASVVRSGAVRTGFGEAALQKENGGHVPTEKVGITSERIALEISKVLIQPRRVVYVPRWLGVVPWLELSFGWAIDRLGPLLLRRTNKRRQPA